MENNAELESEYQKFTAKFIKSAKDFNDDLVVHNSKCVFFGHTPTRYLIDKDEIIAYKRANVVEVKSVKNFYKIHLDCGVNYSNKLGCFCVDNCKEYYVQ